MDGENSCPRYEPGRAVRALSRVLRIYLCGLLLFLVSDLFLFHLFQMNESLAWRIKVTIIGVIVSASWLLLWWIFIRYEARRGVR